MSSIVPSISVLVPTFNQEEFITECLTSIIAQDTNRNVEVIVGDDCSSDKTFALACDVATRAPDNFHFKFNKWQKNKGGLLNINKLLKQSKSRYVVILEGDDYWINNTFLDHAVSFLDKNPTKTLYSARVTARKDNKDLFSLPGWRQSGDEITLERMLLGNFLSLGSTVFHKKYCPSIYLEWRQLPLGDWPLFVRVLSNGNGYLAQEVSMIYRISKSGVWSEAREGKKIKGTIKTALAIGTSLTLTEEQQRLLDIYIQFLQAKLLLQGKHKRRIKQRQSQFEGVASVFKAYRNVAWFYGTAIALRKHGYLEWIYRNLSRV